MTSKIVSFSSQLPLPGMEKYVKDSKYVNSAESSLARLFCELAESRRVICKLIDLAKLTIDDEDPEIYSVQMVKLDQLITELRAMGLPPEEEYKVSVAKQLRHLFSSVNSQGHVMGQVYQQLQQRIEAKTGG